MIDQSVVVVPENVKDLTGQRFGNRTVVAFAGMRYKSPKSCWHVVCDCGAAAVVRGADLRYGDASRCRVCAHHKEVPSHNLAGKRYGKWAVLSFAGRTSTSAALWNCVCDCGRCFEVLAASLLNGGSTQCKHCASTTHGMGSSNIPEYCCWSAMRYRCHNEDFPAYGARGITVCERWDSFENFYADMGPRPSSEHSIDRIDVDGNYTPSNCRWAVPRVQMRNRRNTSTVTYAGETLVLIDAAERHGLPVYVLRQRLAKGWAVERALSTPNRSAGVYRIEYDGCSMTITEAADRYGLPRTTLSQRLLVYGWNVERALTQPVRCSS